jgi:hypothetical protein
MKPAGNACDDGDENDQHRYVAAYSVDARFANLDAAATYPCSIIIRPNTQAAA